MGDEQVGGKSILPYIDTNFLFKGIPPVTVTLGVGAHFYDGHCRVSGKFHQGEEARLKKIAGNVDIDTCQSHCEIEEDCHFYELKQRRKHGGRVGTCSLYGESGLSFEKRWKTRRSYITGKRHCGPVTPSEHSSSFLCFKYT